MPRKLFKRIMPPREAIQGHKFLGWLGDHLHDANLWHLTRHSAAMAVAIGLFCAFMPIPMQMLLAAVLAIGLRGNLAVALAMVWVSNPLTMPLMLYGTYRLGAFLLNMPPQALSLHLSAEAWLLELSEIWQPLLLGSLACGLFFGGIGYAAVKIVWRIMVTRQWRQRVAKRQWAAKLAELEQKAKEKWRKDDSGEQG